MRLFVAIELNAQVKRAVAAVRDRLAEFDRAVRWVRPEQMHLTLKFLGETEDSRAADISKALAIVAEGAAPFDLVTTGAGCFPPRGKVRVVWAGLEDCDGLRTCQEGVEAALEPLGFARESRPFSPHLTVGRVQDDRSDGQLRERVAGLKIERISQPVDSIVLMQSELRPQGARYTKLGEWRLGGK